MAKHIKKAEVAQESRPSALGELIHAHVRQAIEAAVHEELGLALGVERYERNSTRVGYRNGMKARTLTGPTGPMQLTVPRAILDTACGTGLTSPGRPS